MYKIAVTFNLQLYNLKQIIQGLAVAYILQSSEQSLFIQTRTITKRIFKTTKIPA